MKKLLNENYSAKHFTKQIEDITNKFMVFKNKYDYEGAKSPTDIKKTYDIYISLNNFFDDVKDSFPNGILPYKINIYYNNREKGMVKGKYSLITKEISIYVTLNAKGIDIYRAILHEVTHLVDYLIADKKRYRTNIYIMGEMKFENLPRYAMIILYMLWDTSEFNAWQTTLDTTERDFNYHVENLLKCLKRAFDSNDKEEWKRIQKYVYDVTGKEKILNKSIESFKMYFIKTSFKKLKKLITKYH